jgi:hypothetical protein
MKGIHYQAVLLQDLRYSYDGINDRLPHIGNAEERPDLDGPYCDSRNSLRWKCVERNRASMMTPQSTSGVSCAPCRLRDLEKSSIVAEVRV